MEASESESEAAASQVSTRSNPCLRSPSSPALYHLALQAPPPPDGHGICVRPGCDNSQPKSCPLPKCPHASHPHLVCSVGCSARVLKKEAEASSRHCSPWTHALPPCCTGTRQSTSHQPRLQARHEPHHHRGRQNPPNPHALAPRLPVRATRNGPRAQSASAASTRAHTTRPVPPWPPGKRPWPCQRPTGRRRISRSTRSHRTIHGFADT